MAAELSGQEASGEYIPSENDGLIRICSGDIDTNYTGPLPTFNFSLPRAALEVADEHEIVGTWFAQPRK